MPFILLVELETPLPDLLIGYVAEPDACEASSFENPGDFGFSCARHAYDRDYLHGSFCDSL
jgi:hypothetical protein